MAVFCNKYQNMSSYIIIFYAIVDDITKGTTKI